MTKIKVKFTPKFNSREIVNKTIEKDWCEFQARAFFIGKRMAIYMRNYINGHRKRAGGTGNLARSIKFKGIGGAGQAFIWWGIGRRTTLSNKAPYWYVINYGKYAGSNEKFIPGKPRGGTAKFVPGYFGAGNPPDASKRGSGRERFTYASRSGSGMYPGVVRPIHYIEATQHKLNAELRKLFIKLKGMR